MHTSEKRFIVSLSLLKNESVIYLLFLLADFSLGVSSCSLIKASSNCIFFLCFCSLQADFPANTNILYIDLHSAESIGSSSNVKSLPNMVLNTKKRIEYIDQYGDYHRFVQFEHLY